MKTMNRVTAVVAALVFGWLQAATASAATLDLCEWAVNIDGTLSDFGSDPVPANVSTAAFDTATGLGTVTVTVSGAGSHYIGSFFDIEIDERDNTYFNELGAVSGIPGAGQSWEIDEPGYVSGDIFANLTNNDLDDSNASTSPDDVSFAMAWDFILGAGQTGVVTFNLSQTAPTGGFYLTHTDPDSQASLYLSSGLDITGGGSTPVPEPATMVLLGSGLMGLAGWRKRRSKA